MRREEVVIRSLIREWLILEQAAEDGIAAGEAGAQQLSALNSLTDQMGTMLDDVESRASDEPNDDADSVNEALSLFLAGFALSMPKLGKFALYGTSAIIKGYAAMISKLGGGDQANALSRAKKFEEAGDAFYKKTHGWILSFYAKVAQYLFVALCMKHNSERAVENIEWAKSEAGQASFTKVAKVLDVVVSLVLAGVSGMGAWGALTHAHYVTTASEIGLAAVKGGSALAAIAEGFAEVAFVFSEALAVAGVSAALVSEAMDEAKDFFNQMQDAIESGLETVKKTAQAAGLAVALAAGSRSDDDGGSSSRDDVTQISERRFQRVK